MTLQRCMERIAEKEVERITTNCRRYQEQGKPGLLHATAPAAVGERGPEVRRMLPQEPLLPALPPTVSPAMALSEPASDATRSSASSGR